VTARAITAVDGDRHVRSWPDDRRVTGDRTHLVVYVTKGVGDVVADELGGLLPTAAVGPPEEKFLLADVDAADVGWVRAGLRTADDVRLLVAGPRSVADPAGFEELCAEAAERTRRYLAASGSARASSEPWSVTLAARRPVWRGWDGWDPVPLISRLLGGADPAARSRRPVDLRLQVDGAVMHVAVDLDPPAAAAPTTAAGASTAVTRPGALRPSVAAVLVRLALVGADPATAARGLYDPCCGTGTVVLEAARAGLPVWASDIDRAAVELTRARLSAAGGVPPSPGADDAGHRVFVHDLLRGVPQRVDAALVASNLPWGKQVEVPRRGALFDACAALAARSVGRGGRCVLPTTHEEQLLGRLRRHVPGADVTVRRIGLLGQTPAIVEIGRG
jgi:Putative RNA methylase family UPF0020